jgi:mannose-6-phosphate isomerase-like protein (cupin superfamily)
MEAIKCWKEEGVTLGEPHKRHAKVIFAPDRHDAADFTFSTVCMYPKNSSVPHSHDRSELIFVISGRGTVVCDDVPVSIEPDMALLIRPGETHQIINDGDEMLKSIAFFAPAYRAEDLMKPVGR